VKLQASPIPAIKAKRPKFRCIEDFPAGKVLAARREYHIDHASIQMSSIQPFPKYIPSQMNVHFRLAQVLSWSLAVLCLTATHAEEQADEITDPDYQTQGEYVGENQAMQVIARGDGEFDMVIYAGGLPGAGNTTEPPRRLEGDADVVVGVIDSLKLTRINRVSDTDGAQPPANAIVLFDGSQKSAEQNWVNAKVTQEGWLCQGTQTKSTFKDYRLHLEFRTPFMPKAEGQARGNSGVYHQGRYETQILDSFGLEGLDNEAGGIYTVRRPDQNVCYPPMRWQTYDVEFTAARFDASEKKTSDARMTVRLNGVTVHSGVSVPDATRAASLAEGPTDGPIVLQDHGNEVRFRNIWIEPLDADAENRRPIVIGYERFFAGQSSTIADGGELLISSLACAACHQSESAPGNDELGLPEQRGPNLTNVASRVRPDALVAMIADPHAAKPNTTMPDPWGSLTAPDRLERAEAIASYLAYADSGADGEPKSTLDGRAFAGWSEQGKELYHSIGCVACHPASEGNATNFSTTAGLGDPSKKYTLNSLADFLMHPQHVRSGLRMPGLSGTRQEAVKIAAYLLGDSVTLHQSAKVAREIYQGEFAEMPDFDKLTPIKTDLSDGFKIDDLELKENYAVRFRGKYEVLEAGKIDFMLTCDDGAWLRVDDQVLEFWRVGPMEEKRQSLDLKPGIHDVEVRYFQLGGQIGLKVEVDDPQVGRADLANLIMDGQPKAPTQVSRDQFQPRRDQVTKGKKLFVDTGCVHCHVMQTSDNQQLSKPNKQITSLAVADPSKGCLAAKVPDGLPNFQLTPTQRSAIATALQSRRQDKPKSSDQRLQHLTMAALNCYACHRRGEFGGPEPTRNDRFVSTVPEMGEEGRLPPNLDGVGDKLRDDYLANLLQNGAHERPYMKVRMPAYQNETLAEFQRSLVRTDRQSEAAPFQSNASDEKLASQGRLCVGSAGLSCVKCHRFGDQAGTGIGAIDMLKMPTRLRRDWFTRYLMDPTKYRPGTRMPNSFPEGVSALKTLYDGKPEPQINAMWHYLSQGSSAKEPVGLKGDSILLAASDRPRIHRNFFKDVSPRGIAVAYPANLNLIWDADRMSLAKIWKNSFIDAALPWVGRGQGANEPIGDSVVNFEKDGSLARLETIHSPWPTEPARQRGDQFRGYKLDAQGNPEFLYRTSGLDVSDRIVTGNNVAESNASSLRPDRLIRTLTLRIAASPADRSAQATGELVWRIAQGKIESLGKNHFLMNDQVEIKVDGAEASVVTVDGQTEVRAIVDAGRNPSLTQSIAW
jgi:mono/diheme cytochrome c family protein